MGHRQRQKGGEAIAGPDDIWSCHILHWYWKMFEVALFAVEPHHALSALRDDHRAAIQLAHKVVALLSRVGLAAQSQRLVRVRLEDCAPAPLFQRAFLGI